MLGFNSSYNADRIQIDTRGILEFLYLKYPWEPFFKQKNFRILDTRITQQNDAINCGIFMLCALNNILENLWDINKDWISLQDVERMRKRLTERVYNEISTLARKKKVLVPLVSDLVPLMSDLVPLV